jgi:hypothetical protein
LVLNQVCCAIFAAQNIFASVWSVAIQNRINRIQDTSHTVCTIPLPFTMLSALTHVKKCFIWLSQKQY